MKILKSETNQKKEVIFGKKILMIAHFIAFIGMIFVVSLIKAVPREDAYSDLGFYTFEFQEIRQIIKAIKKVNTTDTSPNGNYTGMEHYVVVYSAVIDGKNHEIIVEGNKLIQSEDDAIQESLSNPTITKRLVTCSSEKEVKFNYIDSDENYNDFVKKNIKSYIFSWIFIYVIYLMSGYFCLFVVLLLRKSLSDIKKVDNNL